MKAKKIIVYSLLILFLGFTLYKVVLIYVLKVDSLTANYSTFSHSEAESRQSDRYRATYTKFSLGRYKLGNDSPYPSHLFIEQEKVFYPNYYFFWGKSKVTERMLISCEPFIKSAGEVEYDLRSPLSEPFNVKDNISKRRPSVLFFFQKLPDTLVLIVQPLGGGELGDTLLYKRE